MVNCGLIGGDLVFFQKIQFLFQFSPKILSELQFQLPFQFISWIH